MATVTFNGQYFKSVYYGGTGYSTVHDYPTGSVAGTVWADQMDAAGGDFLIERAFLCWDTSSLPDSAVITGAKIRSRVMFKYKIPGRNYSLVVQNGQPGYPHCPPVSGDYFHEHYSGNGGSVPDSELVNDQVFYIDFNDSGKLWINKTGITKLAIRVSRDIDSSPPVMVGSDDVEGIRFSISILPQLIVTYSIASVVTEAITDLGIDHAHGNGTITGSNITERGFEVKLGFSGLLYGYIERSVAGFSGNVSYNSTTNRWEGTLTKTITETGSFSEGAYEGDLGRFPIAVFSDKLFENETYDYRAYAILGGTTYYGDYIQFTTNSYPSGQRPDDQLPIEDIIPETSVPVDIPGIPGFEEPGWMPDYPPGYPPYEPPFGAMEDIEEEFPGLELPEFEWPEFEYPDFPPYNGSWLGWFYYRKPYTKKDLDELRKKCRMFQDNSVEYALVLNHNSRVLQQFMNSMTIYMDADEHNTFRPIIPPQHLNRLAREPIDILGFKSIINNFISNSIDNTNNVNNNFRLIRDGLSDYAYTEDEGFTHISIKTRLVNDNNPDADRLKKVIDTLNKEMALNYAAINHNLHIVRSVLI